MNIRFLLVLTVGLCAAVAHAQYKYVGPDGRVIYSDTPPPANVKGAQKKDLAVGAPSVSGGSNLPFPLQQASRSFPVTLYTAANCAGCDAGKAYLNKRGIPFSEKTVKSNEDIEILKQISGATSVPVIIIGSTKQSGFDANAWGDSLDAAGYPKTSALPPGYRQTAAVSAAPEAPAPKPQPKPEAAPVSTTEPAPAPDPNRPSWFKGF